ncbi:MAG: PQQ-binding-like beta-propeller repeat protein [Burkholderiales bacterium]|nr:PQQ-binding-like beta-propeller repeat protein [Burkholderiales bacterium]MDE2456116.1 PQQ-binding-like beta-propeller repeat protein [Burkholderiales bacterium]
MKQASAQVPKRGRHPARAAALLAALGFAAAASAASAGHGVEVTVTPEMRGAGMVSSGVKLPPIPPLTGSRDKPVPSWGKPLPYPIVIADRRNNRLIEIAPDKQVIWEFPSPNLKYYRGNDDVFFSPDGSQLMVNEEDNYDIHVVDYDKRQITWSYGVADTHGRGPEFFNFPDDAHLLADGSVLSADIRNCRVVFIDTKTARVTQQWGQPGHCRHDPPRYLDLPNGTTPLDNGDVLITEIPGSWISRVTRAGHLVWAVRAPHVSYPSDAYPTRDGQIIVADYAKPGGVVIFDPATKKVTWEYRVASGEGMLDHPSLALELPNGDVILNDDHRHRVLVIDRDTRKIIWQYGVTDQPGHLPGSLFYPDGLDVDVFRDWKAALKK